MTSGSIVKLLLALVATIALCDCSKERPGRPVMADARIYVGGIDYSQVGPARSILFVYDFDSLMLIDSIPLPARSLDALTDADGHSLFVLTTGVNDRRARSIWKVDLASGQSTWNHDFESWTEPSDGLGRMRSLNAGRWLLVNRTLFLASNGGIIRTLPDREVPFGGPSSGTVVALGLIAEGKQNPQILTGHDVAADTNWGEYQPHLASGASLDAVFTATLHPDMRRVLAIGVRGLLQNAWFVIGDLDSGETLLEEELVYPFGEIAISPDGAIAVVSDPSRTGILDSYVTLDVFDLDSLQLLRRFGGSSTESELLARPGQISFVPGTNAIITAPPADLSSAGGLIVLDVQALEVVKTFWLPSRSQSFEYFTGGLTAGVVTVPN